MRPLGRTTTSLPLPVLLLLLGLPGLVPGLPVLALVLPPAVLQVFVDIDQVPGVGGHRLHPDPGHALLGGSLLVVGPGHVVQQPLGLVETDPTKKTMISSFSWEISFTYVQMIVCVLVLVITFLADEN